jgi:mRNA interferase RelE/StbE
VGSYSVYLTRSAVRELEDVGSNRDRRRLLDRIRDLADDPRPPGSVKLAGREDRIRIRQGDYRILYSVDDEERTISVVRVAHRRDAYRPEP